MDINIDEQISQQKKVGGTAYHALLNQIPKIAMAEKRDFRFMLEDVEADLDAGEVHDDTELGGDQSESRVSNTPARENSSDSSQGGRKPKWDAALNWIDEYKKQHPNTSDHEAIQKYRRKYRQREKPTTKQLQSARSYRKNNVEMT